VLAAGPPSRIDTLLYLRPEVDTEAALRISRRVAHGPIPSVIDDPREVRRQPLSWYVQQITSAFAVICHFLSTDHTDSQLHNAKHAFAAGLAHGLAKPLLMLAHEPYRPPLDYRDLLRVHRTAAIAESIFADWLLPHVAQYDRRMALTSRYKAVERAERALRDITVGEPVAEYESDSIIDYYVSTAVYNDTLASQYSIVVGRKGTGKTAALYALSSELLADPRNHVCLIMPVGYDLEGLIGLLRQELERVEKGFLVESFWKFLLYTELAKSVYGQLLAKPSYYARSAAEAALCEFIEQYGSLITPEFSTRLEAAVAHLRGVSEAHLREVSQWAGEARLRLSELLHDEMLGRLRILLTEVLKDKARVVVLVDNLDKAWNANGDLQLLSELLLGLFGVSRRVAEDFGHAPRGRRDDPGRAYVNLSFALFLRSDIYAAMLPFAKERDKLPTKLIMWNDPEQLKRIIEERFMRSNPRLQGPSEVWKHYFAPNVRGIPTWQYIAQRILPRPRDLIYLVKAALQFAVNRGRSRVEEDDLLDGEKQYSRFALNALIVEAAVRIPNIEDLLLHFVQCFEIITEREIEARLRDVGVSAGLIDVVDWFGQLTFIGFEVAPSRFEFLYDEQDARKFELMAEKTAAETTGGVRRFRLHPAFHSFLEIVPRMVIPGQMDIDLQ
jgi:hypothetical protein